MQHNKRNSILKAQQKTRLLDKSRDENDLEWATLHKIKKMMVEIEIIISDGIVEKVEVEVVVVVVVEIKIETTTLDGKVIKMAMVVVMMDIKTKTITLDRMMDMKMRVNPKIETITSNGRVTKMVMV